MTVPVPLPPNALVEVVAVTVPCWIFRPPLKAFAPLSARVEFALFWVTPVTLLPMMLLMVTVLEPVPELVMVPVLLMPPVENVIAWVPPARIVRFCVPVLVMAPEMVNVLPVPVLPMVLLPTRLTVPK